MSILTKEVDFIVPVKSIKHLEEKGYFIPKYKDDRGKIRVKKGTHIKVKVEDLPLCSSIKVEMECDYCHKRYFIQYNHCTNNKIHEDGKTYCRYCIRKVLSTKNPNIKDEERIRKRTNIENHIWRKSVFERDNYKCILCGSNKDIEAHHIYGYKMFPEKRYDTSNGATLCKIHHSLFHSIYNKKNFTKDDFDEFINGDSSNISDYDGEILLARKAYCIEDKEIINNIKDYAKSHKCSNAMFYQCCNGKVLCANGKHYIWYSDYEKMTEEELFEYLKSKYALEKYGNTNNTIIYEELNLIFYGANKVQDYSNEFTSYNIRRACLRKSHNYYKQDKSIVHFYYMIDYINKNNIQSIDELFSNLKFYNN